MDLNEIQAFVAVARAASFTGASKRIGVPKSTLSRQVSRLETRLGVQLLHRTTRSLRLTEAGRGYYARCLHAIEGIEDAERFALDQMDSPSGTLRVAMAHDVAHLYVADLLPAFHRLYPQVRLELEISNRAVDLVQEGFDVALRGGVLEDSSLIARRIGSSRLLLAAAPAYLEARGRPQLPADLAGHNGLMLGQLLEATGRLRMQGPSGWQDLPLEPWLCANDLDILRRNAVLGLGIAVVEANTAAQDLREDRLHRVLPEYAIDQGGGLFAVYPPTHHMTPKVRAFVDFMLEQLGPHFNQEPAPQAEPGSKSRRGGRPPRP